MLLLAPHSYVYMRDPKQVWLMEVFGGLHGNPLGLQGEWVIERTTWRVCSIGNAFPREGRWVRHKFVVEGVVVWWGSVDVYGRTENKWTWQPKPLWFDIKVTPFHVPGWMHGGDDCGDDGPWGK